MIDNKKVQINLRIPQWQDVKMKQIASKTNVTKTDVLIMILGQYFEKKSAFKTELISEIDDIFSVENKAFLPKNIYKQLMGKSEKAVQEDISACVIQSVTIRELEFIIIDTMLNTTAIMVELLTQKQEIEYLKRAIAGTVKKDTNTAV